MIGRPNNPRQLNVILKTDTQEGILNGIRLEGKEWEGRRLAVQVTFLQGLENIVDDPEELERELELRRQEDEKERKKKEDKEKEKDIKDGDDDDDFGVVET